MKIDGIDWRVDIVQDRRGYWAESIASGHGREMSAGREGPFKRLEEAEQRARQLLTQVRLSFEKPNVVATISEIDE